MSEFSNGYEKIDRELRSLESIFDQLVAACKIGMGFAKRIENSPGWNEEYDRSEMEYMKTVLGKANND